MLIRFDQGKPLALTYRISDLYSGSGQVVSGKCSFIGIAVKTDGTNNVKVKIYDGVDNTGKMIVPGEITFEASDSVSLFSYDFPVYCENGIYVEIETSGTCNWQVLYDQ